MTRIEDLASAYPVLGRALDELRDGGLRDYVGPDPLLNSSVPDDVLSEFLLLAVEEAERLGADELRGLGTLLPAVVVRRGTGAEAYERCLASPLLDDLQRRELSHRVGYVADGDVVLKHQLLVARLDPAVTVAYDAFLRDNGAELAARAPEELGRFLLRPGIPPCDFTFDAMTRVVGVAPNPAPFVQRAVEWVEEGHFEDPAAPDYGHAHAFFDCLGTEPERLAPVRAAIHRRIVQLLMSPDLLPRADHLLFAAAEQGYRFAGELIGEIRAARIVSTPEQRRRLRPVLAGLVEVSRGPQGHLERLGTGSRAAMSICEQREQDAAAPSPVDAPDPEPVLLLPAPDSTRVARPPSGLSGFLRGVFRSD